MDTNGISSNLYQRAVTPTLDVPIIPSVKGKSLASSYQSQPIATNTAFRKIGGASTANVVLNNVTVTGDGLLRGHSSASGKGIGHNGLNAGNTTTASAGVPSSSSANRGLHRGLVSSGVNTPLATVTSVSSIGFDLNLQGRGVIQTTTGLIMNTTSGLKGRDQTGPDQISPKFTKYDLVFLTDDIPADGIIFAKIRNVPDSIVIIRTPEERQKNPERLNLDRRSLEVCPIIQQDPKLRLLNYQNNNIKCIANIENLTNLIFLDLYNNKISSLDGPLSQLPNLRVLMAGKNKLSSITNLENLKKLDVLDLHSNNIRKLEGLETLNELRVLNLAGNHIQIVENVSALTSLTELNLRRNNVYKIHELDRLPALQRLFLSHNNINDIDNMMCLFRMKMLLELSLDGNPICDNAMALKGNENNDMKSDVGGVLEPFRLKLIYNIKSLRYLDLKKITDEERQAANEAAVEEALFVSSALSKIGYSGMNSRNFTRFANSAPSTTTASDATGNMFSNRRTDESSPQMMMNTSTSVSNIMRESKEFAQNEMIRYDSSTKDFTDSNRPRRKSLSDPKAMDMAANIPPSVDTSNKRVISVVEHIRKGKLPKSSVFELENIGSDQKALSIVGEEWKWPSDRRNLSDVTEISFCRMRKGFIITSLQSFDFISCFRKLKCLRLVSNDIKTLSDLQSLRDLFCESIEQLELRDNSLVPVAGPSKAYVSNILKRVAFSMLPNLKSINNLPSSPADQSASIGGLESISHIQDLIARNSMNSRGYIDSTRTNIDDSPSMSTKLFSNRSRKGNREGGEDRNQTIEATAEEFVSEISNYNLMKRLRKKEFDKAFDEVVRKLVEDAVNDLYT